MTDEEKAEEYYEDNECYSHLSEVEEFEEVFDFVKDKVTQAYLDGLKEGRKEQEKSDKGFCESFCMKGGRIAELEKENQSLGERVLQLEKDKGKLIDENAELKKEISILLSCSNCQENKGGYVCEKEYNDKCLAQKIEYIKELKEENAELKAHNKLLSEKESYWEEQSKLKDSQLEEQDRLEIFTVARFDELKAQIEKLKCCENCKHNIKPATKESILFCCECKKLDETKDNILLTKWEVAE